MRSFVLEELVDALNDRSGQFRYFFRLSSGRVEPYAADDRSPLRGFGGDDVLPIHPLSHAQAHQTIQDFIDTLADGELAERLREAAAGAPLGARFLQVLGAFPRARRSWLSYRQRRLEAMALDWLKLNEIDLARFGLDRPARAQEEAAGLRFDESLEPRLAELRTSLAALSERGQAALKSREACRLQLHIDEIYHSNAVRRNRLNGAQTEELILRGTTVGGLSLREHLEAVNLNRALDHAEVLASSPAPLTEHSIRELHARLFASIDDDNAGVYRRIDTRLVGRDYLPPESVLVPALLREFTEWLEESNAEAVAKATAAQAKILHISPFLDGNGRVGRLLSNLVLCKAGYPPAIVRMEDAGRYYDGLRQADAGDMSQLLGLMIDRVEDSFSRILAAMELETAG